MKHYFDRLRFLVLSGAIAALLGRRRGRERPARVREPQFDLPLFGALTQVVRAAEEPVKV